ncbi:MAG: HIT domain-containing protein [Thermoproteales archaeon]|nr:HIT domain-containing protein [Thermoproteales archaeon]
MDILWSPWRMKYIEYITIHKSEGCFICEALKTDKNEDRLVVFKGEKVIVLMNLFPYNTGHLLIAPIRHVPSIEDLSKEEITSLFLVVQTSLKMLRKALKPDAFNIGINLGRVAGAGLEEHVHVHIVPRWNGDTNFMPVLANTKVIPEALKDTYRKIIKYANYIEE